MILITSPGEFLFPVYTLMLVFLVLVYSLFYFILGNPNLLGRIVSWSLGVYPIFTAGFSNGLEIHRVS